MAVSDIDGTEMTLSWQPPMHDGGSPLTGYFLEKREGRKAFWAKVARLPPDETKYRVTDLTEGTDYAFRVTAENKDGSSKPLEMSEQVTPKSLLSKLNINFFKVYVESLSFIHMITKISMPVFIF